ncbi:MAG: hypothetical protein PSV46_14235 [Reyranella sp.]|nr:hypothetical protein [Reyranella sp.]
MAQSHRSLRLLVLSALALSFVAGQCFAGVAAAQSAIPGWVLEKDVDAPSYSVVEPTRTDVNVDSVVLSCEHGAQHTGLQLRLYLTEAGPIAPLRAGARTTALKDDPALELAIDGVSHDVRLVFAGDSIIVADAADGAMPILSAALVRALQRGRRLELRFHLLQKAPGQASSVDGSAVVELQAGRGGSAVAAVQRCAGKREQQLAGGR